VELTREIEKDIRAAFPSTKGWSVTAACPECSKVCSCSSPATIDETCAVHGGGVAAKTAAAKAQRVTEHAEPCVYPKACAVCHKSRKGMMDDRPCEGCGHSPWKGPVDE
jgi:hypothetical protein